MLLVRLVASFTAEEIVRQVLRVTETLDNGECDVHLYICMHGCGKG